MLSLLNQEFVHEVGEEVLFDELVYAKVKERYRNYITNEISRNSGVQEDSRRKLVKAGLYGFEKHRLTRTDKK